jgi:hypothetical protein
MLTEKLNRHACVVKCMCIHLNAGRGRDTLDGKLSVSYLNYVSYDFCSRNLIPLNLVDAALRSVSMTCIKFLLIIYNDYSHETRNLIGQ